MGKIVEWGAEKSYEKGGDKVKEWLELKEKYIYIYLLEFKSLTNISMQKKQRKSIYTSNWARAKS